MMKLVVFDVDGTLVDSQRVIVAAMNAGFEQAGLAPLSPAQVLAIVGLSLPVAVATLLPQAAPEVHRQVVEGYRAAFFHLRQQQESPLYEGALDCLDALSGRDDVLLAIATGKSRRGLDALIEAHGWHHRFISLQTADHHPSKPHPAMLLAALSEAGVDAPAAVMVGDTEFDMRMGVSAGVASFGVGWGYHPRERLVQGGARIIAADYPALTRHLQEWLDE